MSFLFGSTAARAAPAGAAGAPGAPTAGAGGRAHLAEVVAARGRAVGALQEVVGAAAAAGIAALSDDALHAALLERVTANPAGGTAYEASESSFSSSAGTRASRWVVRHRAALPPAAAATTDASLLLAVSTLPAVTAWKARVETPSVESDAGGHRLRARVGASIVRPHAVGLVAVTSPGPDDVPPTSHADTTLPHDAPPALELYVEFRATGFPVAWEE